MGISYSVDADPDTTAKAMLRERHMSHKHSKEIAHVAAHKVGESPGRKPRAFGRATAWNTPQVDVELILEEVSE